MTPQEKAKELVLHFYETVKNKYPSTSAMPLAKQCALIAVNEILEQLNHLPTEGYGMQYIGIIEHWERVKTEIEKP